VLVMPDTGAHPQPPHPRGLQDTEPRVREVRLEEGGSARAGFVNAPVIGLAKSALRPTVPPMAVVAACPTATVSVAAALTPS
jgi:hypothetical protein